MQLQTNLAMENHMWIPNVFDRLLLWRSQTSVRLTRREGPPRRPVPCRLSVDALEDRSVPAASLSISNTTVLEGVSGTQNAELVVRLSAPSHKTVTVNYSTVSGSGSAQVGSDYDAVSGTLTFAPGETRQSILVPVHGDRQPEGDETISVLLQRPKYATISKAWGGVSILDSSPQVSISEYAVASEADGFVTFEVSLSTAYDLPVTVNFGTQDGSAYPGIADAAVAGRDYVATFGTLTFAPGELTKTITVQLIGDTTPEYNEVFSVTLSGASNALIDGDLSEGWIYEGYGPPPR